MVELNVLKDKADEDELVKAFAFDKYLLVYLFHIPAEFEDDLKGGSASERLKIIFDKKGYKLSDNNAITEGKGNEWVITNKKKFIVKKEDEKLNTYLPKNSNYEHIRSHFSYIYHRFPLDRKVWFDQFTGMHVNLLIIHDNDLLKHIKNRRGITQNLLDVDDSEDLLQQMNAMNDKEVFNLFIRYLCSELL